MIDLTLCDLAALMPDISGTQLKVLIYLRTHRGRVTTLDVADGRRLGPGLREDGGTGLDEYQVCCALATLEAMGILRADEENGRKVLYLI